MAGNGAARAESPAWSRLEQQIGWYDRRSRHTQAWYKRIKVLQIVLAASIPVVATVSAPAWVTGSLGALIVVLEGFQQLQQYHANWATYRSTCEALKHEKYLFVAHAGPYAVVEHPERLLAERVEGLVSQEHAVWVSHVEESGRRVDGAKS